MHLTTPSLPAWVTAVEARVGKPATSAGVATSYRQLELVFPHRLCTKSGISTQTWHQGWYFYTALVQQRHAASGLGLTRNTTGTDAG